MSLQTKERTEVITSLLNGTISSIKSIIPLNIAVQKPNLFKADLKLEYGVLIGITGDIKGKLILAGKGTTFSSIGESMYGMALEGEMLSSFSGELGNMIAGGITTYLENDDFNTNITAPTIIEGSTTIKGYEKATELKTIIDDTHEIKVYLLLD